MRVQVARPAEHQAIVDLPFRDRLTDWEMPNVHKVLGLHRHVVKLVEYDDISYVVKELPDHLVEREYRLLRALDDQGLPTAEMVAAITGRPSGEGLVITRHLDYSLPYRSLLMGRGLKIPYLGERLLDALVVLLVRIHLAGFFWGDCSLSNTLFRRDAGALQAYIIDVETAEMHPTLSDGQRDYDVAMARERVGGELFDLQAGGFVSEDVDAIEIVDELARRYVALWTELTSEEVLRPEEQRYRIGEKVRRLNELGFDVDEIELVDAGNGSKLKLTTRVAEPGHHRRLLFARTGLDVQENQARRLLADIASFRGYLEQVAVRPIPETVAANRWLEEIYGPIMSAIPADLRGRLDDAEIFHEILEHRWFLSEAAGRDIGTTAAATDYLAQVLPAVPGDLVAGAVPPAPATAVRAALGERE